MTLRSKAAAEFEDGWVLLSLDDVRSSKQQPANTNMKARSRQEARKCSSRPHPPCGGNPCIVPEVFQLSPSSSPRNVADFMDAESEFCQPQHQLPKTEPTAPSRASGTSEDSDSSALPSRSRSSTDTSQGSFQIVEASSMPGQEQFEFVACTPTVFARQFACRRPRVASGLLWTWFIALVLGEHATTLWWFFSLGLRGLVVLLAPLAVGICFGLCTVGPEKMVAATVSIALAAMPAMPAYSAVLLMTAPGGLEEGPDHCWDILDIARWPALFALGSSYLVSALVPTVWAERPSKGSLSSAGLRFLAQLQKMTRSACIVSAWLYAAVLLHVTAFRILSWHRNANETHSFWHFWGGVMAKPFFHGQGLILTLHALGLACAALRQYTCTELGEDLLPRLLGAQRARALTRRAIVINYGIDFLRRIPQLRRYTPPPMVTAWILVVRRTAPVLFPVLAVLVQLAGRWPMMSLLLGLTTFACLVFSAIAEQRRLPQSSLRRLPLLLPKGMAPCTRKLLGFGLQAAAGVERARCGFASLYAHLQGPYTTSHLKGGRAAARQ